jgi:transcriptional regulator with XRE-family HTH domain
MSVDTAAALRAVDPRELGGRIRRLRAARGLTQGQLAGEDISVAYVSRIEAGTRRPELRVLEKVAGRLSVSVDELVTGVEQNTVEQTWLALRYAELALMSGEPVDAERAATQVLASPDAARVTGAVDEAEYLQAAALEAQGRLAEAAAGFERLRAAEPCQRWLPAMIALSRCYRDGGDLNRAIDVGETALARLREAGLEGSDDEVRLVLAVAAAYFERGDQMYAISITRAAIERADAAAGPGVRAAAYWSASIFESNSGRHGAAISYAERAVDLLRQHEDAHRLARLRAQLGVMLLRSPDCDVQQAEQHLRDARAELAAGRGTAIDLARLDANLASARLADGDVDTAQSYAEAALDAVGAQAPLIAAEAQLVLARVAQERGDKAHSRRHYAATAAALTAAGSDRSAAQAWYELGGLLDQAGDAEQARDAYRSAAAAAGLRAPEVVTTRGRAGTAATH